MLTGRGAPQQLTTSGAANWFWLSSDDDPANGAPKSRHFGQPQAARDELPYKVELWDDAKKSVEQVLAVTANGSIGYAAYYAAMREYPERHVTLRLNNRIVARSSDPAH